MIIMDVGRCSSPPAAAPGPGSPADLHVQCHQHQQYQGQEDDLASIFSDYHLDLELDPGSPSVVSGRRSPSPSSPHRSPSHPFLNTVTSPPVTITTATTATTTTTTANKSIALSVHREASLDNATPVIPSGISPTSPVSSAGENHHNNEYISVVPRDLDRYPRGHIPVLPFRVQTSTPNVNNANESYNFDGKSPVHARLVSEPFVPILKPPPVSHKRAKTMAVHNSSKRPAPLQIHYNARSMSTSIADVKQPKTPGNKISSFFGWKTATSPGADSSSTDISDGDNHPQLQSPLLPSMKHSSTFPVNPITAPIDVTKANGIFQPSRNPSLGSGPSSMTPGYNTKIAELENELREISSELAGSIRREIELEDLVERLQMEMPTDGNRRTSDYFSDSGAGSIRYNLDSGGRVEEIEKIKRAAEQERAQLKVEFSQKWQEERSRRTASESHVQILESQVQQLRRERVNMSDLFSRNKELEIALEDTRRKLAEERQVKDNFEDLLTAMRVELEQLRNERDHLRDNLVPQLQHSLESAAPPAVDRSEIDRLLGEVAALKVENASLAQLQGGRFTSIAEEDGMTSPRSPTFGLSRSNSWARMPPKTSGLGRSGSLSRSNSMTKKERESRESLVEKVKDVEAQRDALHQTLKSLLFRHAYQARESERRVKALELELEYAEELRPRGRLGYEKEVCNLREEINHLRQRAEDALEQKWQCEKGLAGLKMDLDRAEQQTTSLRMLLQEHDIAVPDELAVMDREDLAEVQATSSSLEAAYEQLQADMEYAEANISHTPEEERIHADQLAASVNRTEALADHVRQQLETNSILRGRLADAIGKGEKEQQTSAVRINELQNRLKDLEERLVVAQQQSEEEMAEHEEEISKLKESHNAQLLRMKNGSRSPVMLSPRLPNSPFAARSPRLDKTTSGEGIPLNEAVQIEDLEKKVKELEKALRDADLEMEEVVSRMNRAQIEVAELQSDRDNALRQTRKLQAEILAERQAFKALMG